MNSLNSFSSLKRLAPRPIAIGISGLGIAAAMIATTPTTVFAAGVSFAPAGTQLDLDAIHDIVPGASITFNIFLDSNGFFTPVNGSTNSPHILDALSGVSLLVNFDPGELEPTDPLFTNSGVFASGTGSGLLGGSFIVNLSQGRQAFEAGNISLGSVTFLTKNLDNNGSTDFSVSATSLTVVNANMVGTPDYNGITGTPVELGLSGPGLGLGMAQIVEVQPVPAPLPFFGAACAFGWSRRLRNRLKITKRAVIPATTASPPCA
jgi:hypothetical protein